MTLDHIKNTADVAGGSAAVSVYFGWLDLPTAVLILTGIYGLIRIWETATCRRVLRAVCMRCHDWWTQ